LAENQNCRNYIVSCSLPFGNIVPSLQRWLSSYRQGGVTELLSYKSRSGMPRIINPKTLSKLEEKTAKS
jgi:hypothetical protein